MQYHHFVRFYHSFIYIPRQVAACVSIKLRGNFSKQMGHSFSSSFFLWGKNVLYKGLAGAVGGLSFPSFSFWLLNFLFSGLSTSFTIFTSSSSLSPSPTTF